MADTNPISSHYAKGGLTDRIASALRNAGIDVADVTVEDLGPVDEFHTGGRAATVHLLSHLDLAKGEQVLDIGCGIGGTARHLVHEHGVHVHGIDLTSEFVETGEVLDRWVSLDEHIDLRVADALAIPFDDDTFDAVTLLHVGMNVADKSRLFAEIARVLKPGARLALYDVMRTGDGEPVYPLPWASDAATNFLDSPERYEDLMHEQGLSVVTIEHRTEFAQAFFAGVRALSQSPHGPPPIGLHLLMGPEIGRKIGNFANLVERGALAPVEMIATNARQASATREAS